MAALPTPSLVRQPHAGKNAGAGKRPTLEAIGQQRVMEQLSEH
eukprot:CAMPEP_0172636230 /NCGR_PEP_ID=MMETSP1068-20121228/202985_1 /TAXON_ID=35684 /ORGANISM="Pseudopedinella elastica, Strain CCMP716" /LENGTH=42 /DNA_ID= /DNA_START= /DNA_END= /DNA_ORIENTATION=